MSAIMQAFSGWGAGREVLIVRISDLKPGGHGEVQLSDGRKVLVNIVAVDTISTPHRAKVSRVDNGETFMVPVLPTKGKDTLKKIPVKNAPKSPALSRGCKAGGEDDVHRVSRFASFDSASLVTDGPSTVVRSARATGSAAGRSLVSRMASFDMSDLWTAPLNSEGASRSGGGGSGGSRSARGSGYAASAAANQTRPRRKEAPAPVASSWLEPVGSLVSRALSNVGVDPVDFGLGVEPTFKRSARPPPVDGQRTADAKPRIFHAYATVPVELVFNLPADPNAIAVEENGERSVLINGPHGPMRVPIQAESKPGDQVVYRLGPGSNFQAKVPEDGKEGDLVVVELDEGKMLKTKVPPGKNPGDTFEVAPAVLMVQVPHGARVGDTLKFKTPSGEERLATVPVGYVSGHYFEHPYEEHFEAPTDDSTEKASSPGV
eukprot:TRINITY_DN7714_c0_g1_i2.p1 TRINITY_DN7714_c0_g1~~TRINITY_DN7714_c0_g1_i2.p1  ORF type:complete len:433 (-),score=79.62 TRINITY_DN7714_c0_g1_i2:70-1368(-)